MTIIDQLELELAAPVDETGVERAERNAEPDWWSAAMSALKAEAKTGLPFDAWGLEQRHELPPLDHPNRWGALFRAANTLGLIAHHGYHKSQRPGRAHGVCSVWVGVA